MGEPIRIDLLDDGHIDVVEHPQGSREITIGADYAYARAMVSDAARRRLIEALGGVPTDDLARVGMFIEHEAAVTAVQYHEPFPWPDPREPDAIPIFVRRSDLPEEGRP